MKQPPYQLLGIEVVASDGEQFLDVLLGASPFALRSLGALAESLLDAALAFEVFPRLCHFNIRYLVSNLDGEEY